MSNRNHSDVLRQQLAYEAARIISDQGDEGFERARRKAAERAGVGNRRLWPNNEEIQDALRAQQRLFRGVQQAAELVRLRQQALLGMRFFADFSPRLVGAVLDGYADGRQSVRFLLFAERTEDVVFTLLARNIPWKQQEQTLRFSGGVRRACPLLTFFAGETCFELVVLPPSASSNLPLDPISERPQRGADADEVAGLLADAKVEITP